MPEGEIAALLRSHRSAAGLTQEELADRAGVSARAISDIERGLRTRIYPDTAARLAEALGLEQAAETRFVAASRSRRAGSRIDRMPVSSGREDVVPARLDRFVDRKDELASIVAAFRTRGRRLVSLTGTGGVGKSRLAVEAAVALGRDFADGVTIVPLAGVREADLVASTIAHAMGVRRQRGPSVEALAAHLRDRDVLLVLDNFEQVIDAAPVIVDVLASCPRVHALVTSRAALSVTGEQELRIAPLPVPTRDQHTATTAELQAIPSVELLVDRLVAVDPGFRLDEHNAFDVIRLARGLEGIPLAIELAARRIRHMGIGTLREQVSDRLDLPSAGVRDLPNRQQTMRRTVAWSYDLLPAAARRMFRVTSVFMSGWTVAAAASASGERREASMGALSVLVDHGLVHLDAPGGGEDRYRMLDVVRDFAGEALVASGEALPVRDRHASFFVELARHSETELRGAAQDAWYGRLDRDHDNFRAALRWLIDEGRATDALRLAASLWMFWRQHGDFAEGRAWLRETLDRPDTSVEARLAGLWGAAWLAYHQADYPAMDVYAREHMELARETGDRSALRNALTEQGMLLMVAGRSLDALEPFGEAFALAEAIGDEWLLALSRFNLGHATCHAGRPVEGERLLRAAEAAFVSLGDSRFAARAASQLAVAALIRGDPSAARSLAAEGLDMFRPTDEKWGIAECLEVLSAAETDPCAAARLGGAARALRDDTATEPMAFDARVIDPRRHRLREAIDSRAWDACWDAGCRMTSDEAVAYALSPTR